jgi:hypothetical protein
VAIPLGPVIAALASGFSGPFCSAHQPPSNTTTGTCLNCKCVRHTAPITTRPGDSFSLHPGLSNIVLHARFGHVWATMAFLSRDAAVEAYVLAEHLHKTLLHVVAMESAYKAHHKGQIAVSTSANGVDSCKLC